MLAHLDVEVRKDSYVFAVVDARSPIVELADATIREAEGLTVVVTARNADEHGLANAPRFAWLTLTVTSSLEAVGLTAAFSTALAAEGISCNVLAGFHHDHLLVPESERGHAVRVLRALRGSGPEVGG